MSEFDILQAIAKRRKGTPPQPDYATARQAGRSTDFVTEKDGEAVVQKVLRQMRILGLVDFKEDAGGGTGGGPGPYVRVVLTEEGEGRLKPIAGLAISPVPDRSP